MFNLYFGGLKGCVFDIETTGFQAKSGRAKVILTAMLVPTEHGVRVTQFLAENSYEEDRVIAKTMEFLAAEGVDYLITFNGTTFDVPFMRDRIEALHLPYELNMYNLDLYSFLKRYSVLPQHLESMSQKSIEYHYGLSKDRQDVINGAQSVKLYFEYMTTHDGMTEKIILTHNREDVVQLYKLLKAAGYLGFSGCLKDGMDFHTAIAKYGIPVGDNAMLTAQPQITRSRMRIRGRQRWAPKLQESLASCVDAAVVGVAGVGDSAIAGAQSLPVDRPVRVYYSEDEGDVGYPFNARVFAETEEDMSIEFVSGTHSFMFELPLMTHGNSSYCNVLKFVTSEDALERHGITDLAGYVNGFLILIDEGEIQQREINWLTNLLCEYAIEKVSSL